MQLKKGQRAVVRIEDIAFGGRGVGRFEGQVVFVNGVLKGEEVEVEFKSFKKGFSEAELVKVVKAAGNRLKPRCQYFEVCGGCSYQYMPYEEQLAIKQKNVRDSFERIGKFREVVQKPILGCEQDFYYRNKMEFSFGYDGEMRFALGMHEPGRRYDILDLQTCYLQSPRSVGIVNFARDFVIKKGWRPFQYSNGEGFVKHLVIREGKRTGERMVIVTGSNDLPVNFAEEMAEMAEQLMANFEVTSVYFSMHVSERGKPKQIEDRHFGGKQCLSEKLILRDGRELKFEIMPRAFFQVNTVQAEILYSEVLALAEQGGHSEAFDLFCGTGTIGIALAGGLQKVVGVELNPEAIKTAEENAALNGVKNIDFHCGDVAKVLEKLDHSPSLIVLDPPRAGLTPKMLELVQQAGAREIIYVSCNPATQARDCQTLCQEYGYKLEEMTAVDMFPQTYHVENIARLMRN